MAVLAPEAQPPGQADKGAPVSLPAHRRARAILRAAAPEAEEAAAAAAAAGGPSTRPASDLPPPLADRQQRPLQAPQQQQQQQQQRADEDRSAPGRTSGLSSDSNTSSRSGSGGTAGSSDQATRVQAAMQAHAHVLVMHPVTLKFQTPGGRLCPSLKAGAACARALAVPREHGCPTRPPVQLGRLHSAPRRHAHHALCAHAGLEEEYNADMVQQRRPVLAFIFFFDVAVYLFRLIVKRATAADKEAALHGLLSQMGNMLLMYTLVSLFNWRQRRNNMKCGAQVSAQGRPPRPRQP